MTTSIVRLRSTRDSARAALVLCSVALVCAPLGRAGAQPLAAAPAQAGGPQSTEPALPAPPAASGAAVPSSPPHADAISGSEGDIRAPAPGEPRPATGPFPFLLLRPAPPDIGAFPARPTDKPQPTEPSVELHGFVAGWFTPYSQSSPVAARDTFRLRFGVLRVDARPLKHVSVLARLGMMLPSSPLLDFALTYTPHTAFGVTVGQFRLPIGAAATTLAPQLVLLDRPSYVYAFTKLAFRDVGVMVHSATRGIADGLLHYRLALTSGAGRAGVGVSRPPDELQHTLLAARVMVDLGRVLSARATDRLVLGASYVRSRDPAIATGDAVKDRQLAVNVLGKTLVPIGLERTTQLSGADLTFNMGPWYAQAELLYLHSLARDKSVKREGFGTNLDLAYTLPFRPLDVGLQLAGRAEHYNPRLHESRQGLPNDAVEAFMLGINGLAGPARISAFGSLALFEDSMTRTKQRALEVSLRASSTF